MAVAAETSTKTGVGLITGQPFTVQLESAPPGTGIVFRLQPAGDNTAQPVTIAARPEAVVDSKRGVTLGHSSGLTLSIVEHFLAAAAMAGLRDAVVTITSQTPGLKTFELPILDGSSVEWLSWLRGQPHFLSPATATAQPLPQAVLGPVTDTGAHLYALPAPCLEITYALDYPHARFGHSDVSQRFATWRLADDPKFAQLAPARTFGFVEELPELQARGLARGVSADNTLGLKTGGGYTDTLRLEDEPLRHKMIDLIGDLTLYGVDIRQLGAHIYALNAGHTAHLAFGRQLAAISQHQATVL